MFGEKKVSIFFFIFYVLAFLVEAYFIVTDRVDAEVYVKPLLMSILIVMYVLYAEKINFIYFLILIFSLIADYFFIYAINDDYMLIGMILFSLTHILYIILFYDDVKKIPLRVLIKTLVPFVVSTGVIFYIIQEDVPDKLYHSIFIHSTILAILASIAFLKYSKNNSKLNFKMFIGIYSYIIADCLYGVYKFTVPTKFFILFVVFLYAVGQYLICRVIIAKSVKN